MKMQEENHELKSRADISDADCKIATIKSKLLQGQVDPLSKQIKMLESENDALKGVNTKLEFENNKMSITLKDTLNELA